MYTVSPHSVVPYKFIFLFSVNFSCSQPTKVPACQHLKNEVLNCYKQNPTQSLKCSQQVRAFINCVEQSQMVRGAHSILYRNSWSLTAKELILERVMWQPSNYFFFHFLFGIKFTKGICSRVSISSLNRPLDWHLTSILIDTWLTREWHSVDISIKTWYTRQTLCQQSLDSYMKLTKCQLTHLSIDTR